MLVLIEMESLWIMCGVTQIDRKENEVMRPRLGVRENMSEGGEGKDLKVFGYMKRMSEPLMFEQKGKVEGLKAGVA